MQAIKTHVWEAARAAEMHSAGSRVEIATGGRSHDMPETRSVRVIMHEPQDDGEDVVSVWTGTVREWRAALDELRARPVAPGLIPDWTPGPVEASCIDWFGQSGRRAAEVVTID